MPVSTVNISFQKELLVQLDQIAKNEARTRSELIREAVRMYIKRRKEWEMIFKTGKKIGANLSISEKDLIGETKKSRAQKNQ
jgi:metal-responsive CopG/Arc/MetJ family transcriptional regulator